MKILVVDDEPDIQLLFQQRFRRELKNGRISFEFALSGEEALTYLNQENSEVILILSDINMPGMSGLELLEEIRTRYSTAPPFVMMITAYNDDDNFQKSIALGANDFLSKPLNFEELKDKLKALI